MSKVLIIAEAGVNHNGDISIAKDLIDAIAEAGADYVKFQTFKAENLVSGEAKKADYQVKNSQEDFDDSQLKMLKALELSYDDQLMLKEYCISKKIKFLSSAFDLDALDFLIKLNVDLIKIPSGEITNLPYLKKAGLLGKKIILSTGMSTIEEIEDALNLLIKSGAKKNEITILHCNTEYPTPLTDVNLLAMNTIRQKFGVEVGYSDHTAGIEVAVAAVALGASVIEKHFTLDRNMTGPDHKASLEPHELRMMVQSIRNVETALGSAVKSPSASEKKNIIIARKSIHIKNFVKKGNVISESDLEMKRPGDGISPMKMYSVIGKRAAHDMEMDYKIKPEDLE